MFVVYLLAICFSVISGVYQGISRKKSQEPSLYGPFIVTLHDFVTHQDFDLAFQKHLTHNFYHAIHYKPKITRYFHQIMHGLTIQGISRDELQGIYGVKMIHNDLTKHITSLKSWGIDRLDQKTLPLDDQYHAIYTGLDVDVYVVDTGIDTNHIEFSNTQERTVLNIYNVFGTVTANTDGNGHGSHVAGTVGGITVGVSPKANLYGLKVLSDEGEGDTSAIIESFDYLVQQIQRNNRWTKSIVTMSLGGECDNDCSQDPLVVAVENLISQGIVVSVAAGNEGCNGCFSSPNAAPNAITVGASDKFDKITYFSNYGECIDVIAPGLSITSVCSSKICDGTTSYMTMSGTSMATPHVAGVLAQILQKYGTSNLGSNSISDVLSCDASPNILTLASIDSITRDYLLQVPMTTDTAVCDPGSGCDESCNSAGACLPVPVTDDYQCYCDAGKYGDTCDLSMNNCNYKIKMKMFDAYGDGWTYNNYAITDSNGRVVAGAYDSLCYGEQDSRSYCIPDGCYKLDVARGYYAGEVSWNMCTMTGGSPWSSEFCVDNTKKTCKEVCNQNSQNVLTPLTLRDSYGDGWGGAYYAVYNTKTAEQVYGGTLLDGDSEISYLCLLEDTTYIILIIGESDVPSEVSYKVCDTTVTIDDVVELQLTLDKASNTLVCHASISVTSDSTCTDNFISYSKLSFLNDGWHGSTIQLHDTHGALLLNDTLAPKTFYGSGGVCLADGCYNFAATSNNQNTDDLANYYWMMCRNKGSFPWNSQLCVNKNYDLCYGLSGCPVILSYSHYSDLVGYILSHYDSYYEMEWYDDYENIHGIHELCDMYDGQYNLLVGFGKLHTTTSFELCKMDDIPIPSYVSIDISNNGTQCDVLSIKNLGDTCSSSQVPVVFVKLDEGGDGWSNSKYSILDQSSKVVTTNTLKSGMYGYDTVCLVPNTCYKLRLISGNQYTDEIIWLMCGIAGGISESYYLSFCVDANGGCVFSDLDDDTYTNTKDDDFPNQSALTPTIRPTTASKPVISDDDSDVKVLSYTVDMNVKIVSSSTDLDAMTLNEYDILALSAQRVLDLHSIDVWDTTVVRAVHDPASAHRNLPHINVNLGLPTADSNRHHQIHTKSSQIVSTSTIFYAKCTILIELVTVMPSKTKSESDFVLQYAHSSSDLLQETINSILPVLQATKDITAIQSITVDDIVSSSEYNVTSRGSGSRPPQIMYDTLWNSDESTESADPNTLSVTLLAFVIVLLLFIILYLLYQRNAKKDTPSPGDIEMNATRAAVENPIFKVKKITANRRANSSTKYSLVGSDSPLDAQSDENTNVSVQL